MKSVKGSQTEKNLLKTFAGESQARMRYTYYASQAKKDGFVQISQVFEETANQEKEHAKRMFKFLEGGMLEITASYPAGKIGTTEENLTEAAAGENEEWTMLYPEFARIARSEGYEPVAKMYEAIVVAERQHEKRYLDLLKNLRDGLVFKKPKTVVWRCMNCGYLHEGAEAPAVCSACLHPQAYFEVLGENW